ncbi:MAG: zinc metallopeptidase [Clostridium sp.]|nr:zinc metallopeptidase [Clostridium sp.]
MPFYYYYDPTYILILIGMVLSLLALGYVKSTYAKYSRVQSRSGLTGAQVAERILHQAGIYDVRIEHVSGNLTDHYDPRSRVVRLSDAVYGSSSVAAQAVAAHECGHVMQHATGYGALRFRNHLVPVAQFGANISWPLILFGFFLNGQFLITFGILLFSLAVLFQVVTLPVEFNASGRALKVLEQYGILGTEEVSKSRKVLKAAALTYVAAAAASILQLLRLLLLFNRRNND